MIRPTSYQVLITPQISKGVYGTTLDITQDINIDDYVKENGIGSIKKEIDNGDFDIGVFVFDNISLNCINFDGRFSDPQDSRTIFKYSRDKAKVKINFYDGTSNTPMISFKGIIDDRSSKLDFKKSELTFVVLSHDSIINRHVVPGGTVANGSLISTAIKQVLNTNDITSVLNYSPANINVLNDYIIDDASDFAGNTAKEVLDKLLLCSNSVLIIDDSDNIIVRSRDYNSGTQFDFFGDNDPLGRQNIINIKKYNNGLQRAFNTIVVNSESKSDAAFIDMYGDNRKKIDFGFITNVSKSAEIAQNILDYWKVPKIELIITAKTSEVRGLRFFDLVSVDYGYRTKPANGSKLPMYGSALYGTAIYPYIFGNLKINPNTAFKVIGIEEDPKTFLTQVKLRQVGITITDGYFSTIGSYYGFALYGFNRYQQDFDRVNPSIRSYYGAALYGTVHYGNI